MSARAKRLSVSTETPKAAFHMLGVRQNEARRVFIDVDGLTVAEVEVSESTERVVGVHVTIREGEPMRGRWKRSGERGRTTFSLQVRP